MEKYIAAAYAFMNEMKYFDNPRVLGVVVSGSYTTGYQRKGSDIDIHVVMKTGLMERITKNFKIYRGVKIVDGFKVEYFEKPISDLYKSAKNDFYTHGNALVPIILYGQVLYSRGNKLNKLREYIKEIYSKPLPALKDDDAREMALIIENRISKLRLMLENSRPDFDYNYYLIVEKIRKAFSRMSGCADIPVDKAIRVYTDKPYRESFNKSLIPDAEFIDMYIKAVTEELTREEKMQMVENLYEHMTKDLNIDPDNYRISIKSRNNPLNRNHE